MSFDLCFPTAILNSKISNYDTINSSLLTRISEIQQKIPSGGVNWLGRPYNTCGTFDIVQDPAFETVMQEVTKMVHVYASRLGVNIHNNTFTCKEGWLNVYKKTDFQEFHYHGGFLISAVYYVKTPPNSSQIIFESPLPVTMNPLPIKLHGPLTDERVRYNVEEGQVVVFRSHLKHCVPAHLGDEERISLAFNFK